MIRRTLALASLLAVVALFPAERSTPPPAQVSPPDAVLVVETYESSVDLTSLLLPSVAIAQTVADTTARTAPAKGGPKWLWIGLLALAVVIVGGWYLTHRKPSNDYTSYGGGGSSSGSAGGGGDPVALDADVRGSRQR